MAVPSAKMSILSYVDEQMDCTITTNGNFFTSRQTPSVNRRVQLTAYFKFTARHRYFVLFCAPVNHVDSTAE